MKTLLTASLLFVAALTASAQATNVTINVLVEEPNRTNTLTATLTDLHTLGLTLSWQAAMQSGTTNTFRNHVRQEVRDRLESLRAEGKAYQLKTNKIDLITQSIQLNWENAPADKRKLLTDWLAAFPPPQ